MTYPHVRTVLLTALLLALLVAITACADGPPPTDPAATATPPAPVTDQAPPATAPTVEPERITAPSQAPDPGLATVDRTDIDAVTAAVVTAFNTADTATDAGPNTAAARTLPLLTADYATTIRDSPPLRSPGAQWNTWAGQGVRLRAEVQPLGDDRPPDTATTATRIVLVTQTPTTAAGDVLDPVVTVAYVLLRRSEPAGWAVAQVTQR